MDLDLAGTQGCPHCDFSGYDDDFKKGRCPRCRKSITDEPDGSKREPAGSKLGGGRRPSPKGRGKPRAGNKVERTPQPAEKRQVILTEDFKTRVFEAFQQGDPSRAQDLCMELAGANQAHAKQVYGYLLGIARKKGWLGARKPRAEEAAPPPGVGDALPPMPGGGALPPPGMGGALPPPGMPMGSAPGLGPPGGGLAGIPGFGVPGGALAPQGLAGIPGFGAPGGVLPPPAGSYPQGAGQDFPTIPLPPPDVSSPGVGQDFPTIPLPPPDVSPPGVGQDFQTIPLPPPDMPAALDSVTIRLPAGSQAIPLPIDPPLSTAPQAHAPASWAPERPARAPEPAPQAPEPQTQIAPAVGSVEPGEHGFLARVAMEGRSAQVSLLCLAGRYSAALEMAKGTLARAPENARAHAALGESLAGLGDEQQALQSYSTAVRADPTDTVCVRGYARHLARVGRHAEAAAAYKRIVGPAKGRVEDAVALAEALRKVDEVEGARRVLEEVMRRDPQSLEPLRQEIERRADAGDLTGAAERLEQLLLKEEAPHPISQGLAERLAPGCVGSASLARVCAQVFDAGGRSLQAVRLLLPVVAREPHDVGLRRALGLSYARLGATRLAQEHLQAVVERGSAGADELLALGEVLVGQGELEAGIKALEGARDVRADDAEIRRALARALAARGDLERAVRELRAAHQLARGDEAALEDELDRITARAFEQQVEEIESCLRRDADDHEARLRLAGALAQQGELDEALVQLERVAGEIPERAIEVATEILSYADESTRLVLLLARLLRRKGDVIRSIELIEEQLSTRPDDQELQLALYESYARGGRREEALEGLRSLAASGRPQMLRALVETTSRLQEGGGDPDFFLPAARALRRLGDLDEALRVYGSYLVAVPEDHEARQECAHALENAGQWGEAYNILAPLGEALEQLSLGELEHLARVALRARKASQAVALFKRAVDRHPDDFALRRGLEEALERQRAARIKELEDARSPEELTELAGLFAEAGRDEEARGVLASLGRTGENPELDYLRFCGEHFARSGRPLQAEASWRAMAALLSHAPGSEPFKAFLYRVAELHTQASDRRSARQALLEIQAYDPNYQDVERKLEALTDVVPVHGRPDERVMSLVEVDAPLATIFDALRHIELDV